MLDPTIILMYLCNIQNSYKFERKKNVYPLHEELTKV